MSERIPNKKQNFDGIDPQESLIKSLESIKSLLKQGDSKITEARENIARADSIGNNSESQLSQQNLEMPNTAFTSSNTIQKPDASEKFELSAKQNLNEITEDDIEEIIVDSVPADNIFNSVSKLEKTEENTQANSTKPVSTPTALNELYDHDLIVPMLDEIVIPENQNSSLFNMDSSVEIKLDSKLKSALLELDGSDAIENKKLEQDFKATDSIKNESTKSTYNTIKKPDVNTNADIISFELNSNIKKNNLKKFENKNTSTDKSKSNTAKIQNSISLVEDSQLDIDLNSPQNIQDKTAAKHVVIKETTINKSQLDKNAALVNKKITNTKNTATKKSVSPKSKVSEFDLTPAIDSTTYTDDVLANISKSNNEVIKKDSTASQKNKNKNKIEDIDFTKINGLGSLKFNADKMSALQKRVEKRVHNRLIQLIVQLDDEIKNIFTDEIKNCIALELKNKDN